MKAYQPAGTSLFLCLSLPLLTLSSLVGDSQSASSAALALIESHDHDEDTESVVSEASSLAGVPPRQDEKDNTQAQQTAKKIESMGIDVREREE
jgi:hypothetical protein